MSKAILRFGIALVLLLAVTATASANDKPSFDVDWYGYVKLDASYDQNLTSHGNFAMWVQPQASAENDEQFNMTHKQTRFGAVLNGQGYGPAAVMGKLEFDFYGSGGAENTAMLLLRHAFFSLQTGGFELIAGQTWDLIGPLNPVTLNYPVMWGCGNPGYRRPQIRLTYNVTPGDQTNVRLAGGVFRTIGSDLTPTLSLATEASDGSDDGTDAGIPTVQGLFDITHKLSSGASLQIGVSGLIGQLKAEGTLGTNETYHTQGVVGHLKLSFAGGFGIAGEAFTGTNLGSYNGGINNANTINGVDTKGGWGYLWFQPHAKVTLGAGGGMDDPDDATVYTNSRSKNQSYFGNIKFQPIPAVTLGVEVSQWETSYKNADLAKSMRAQTSFVLNF